MWILIGALSGFGAVAAGAFGAHALRESLTPESLEVFNTGARYHLIHSVLLVLTGLLQAMRPTAAGAVAAWAIAIGIVLFSGSLYVLALSGARWWGAVTPFGGGAFLTGWAALAVAGWRIGASVRNARGSVGPGA